MDSGKAELRFVGGGGPGAPPSLAPSRPGSHASSRAEAQYGGTLPPVRTAPLPPATTSALVSGPMFTLPTAIITPVHGSGSMALVPADKTDSPAGNKAAGVHILADEPVANMAPSSPKRGALPKEVQNSPEMVGYRRKQADAYAAKMLEMEKVDVSNARYSGLLCKLRDGHTGGVTAVQFAEDGNWLVSAGIDGAIFVWDLEKQNIVQTMRNHDGAVHSLQWWPLDDTNDLLSAGQDGTVKVWDVDTGSCKLTIRDHGTHSVYSALWSSDGEMLATAGGSGRVFVYNMARAKLHMAEMLHGKTKDMIMVDIRPFGDSNPKGHAGAIKKLLWSHDNLALYTAGVDGMLKAWNVTLGGRLTHTYKGHTGPVNDVSLDTLGNRLCTASGDGSVRVWLAATTECLHVLHVGHVGPVWCVQFTPEAGGRRVISGGEDKCVCIWEASSGLLLQKMETVHKGAITSLTVRYDGLAFATGGLDKTVGVWRALRPSGCETCSWATYSCCTTTGQLLSRMCEEKAPRHVEAPPASGVGKDGVAVAGGGDSSEDSRGSSDSDSDAVRRRSKRKASKATSAARATAKAEAAAKASSAKIIAAASKANSAPGVAGRLGAMLTGAAKPLVQGLAAASAKVAPLTLTFADATGAGDDTPPESGSPAGGGSRAGSSSSMGAGVGFSAGQGDKAAKGSVRAANAGMRSVGVTTAMKGAKVETTQRPR